MSALRVLVSGSRIARGGRFRIGQMGYSRVYLWGFRLKKDYEFRIGK
jgi:hypothetical protein